MEQIHLFTKKLKPTHINHTLSVPTHVLLAFQIPEGTHMMRFEAVDAIDNVWRFCLSIRQTGVYPKPALLRSSWFRFVKQKGLVPNDRVVFFMEKDETNELRSYTVRAQRKVIRLMGQDIWVDPETPVRRGGHRGSSSDSFAYIDAADASNIDYAAQDEYREKCDVYTFLGISRL
ncbi:unnamed protein product [Dovyalis caffra]|uniref:TF-B3 domain-containing protein n=1 Tax=Dovyalis caffra TaxID=77055 RepID=A0AAV1SVJ9_9ROSI|nr:unnamed protein product [Dovyalis caffra]